MHNWLIFSCRVVYVATLASLVLLWCYRYVLDENLWTTVACKFVYSFLFCEGKSPLLVEAVIPSPCQVFHSCKANSFYVAAKIACLSHKRAINCQNEEIQNCLNKMLSYRGVRTIMEIHELMYKRKRVRISLLFIIFLQISCTHNGRRDSISGKKSFYSFDSYNKTR